MIAPTAYYSHIRDFDHTAPNEPAAEVSTDVDQRIAERLVRSLTPVKPMPGRMVLLSACLAIFVTVAAVLFAVVGTRGAENMTLMQLGGVLAAILASAGF